MRIFLAILAALLIALGLYAYAPEIPHASLVARYGGSPTQPITLADGSTAYYRDQGARDGVPVVLLHGSNLSLFSWEGWVPVLATKYRVITVDLPGHGLTGRIPGDDYSVEGMEAFFDRFTAALHVDHFVVGGNSMGGGLAARIALDEPGRVIALILVDAHGVRVPGLKQDIPLGFKLARIPVLNRALTLFTPKAMMAEGIKKAYGNPALVSDAQVERDWMLLRHEGNRLATVKRFSLPEPPPLNPELARIRAPTLVLWGEKDRLLPLAMGKIFASEIPGAEAHYFPGVGHVPQQEIPEQSGTLVASFLDRLPKTNP